MDCHATATLMILVNGMDAVQRFSTDAASSAPGLALSQAELSRAELSRAKSSRRGGLAPWVAVLVCWLGCCGDVSSLTAASYRTRNFMVDAPTAPLAKAVGDAAEGYRRSLAEHWLGGALPPWPSPCPIRVIAGPQLAAQGVTEYNRAPVRDFRMEVVGTPRRILDSVLPHEVTHTILATHFGRPLPRWADEGICTTVEHEEEKAKHEVKLREFLASRRGIAMNRLFLLTEYPSDVLPMYAQGYSVCRFLIEQRGPRAFIDFLSDYMQRPSWTQNIRKHYGYRSLADLQEKWLAWVSVGSGPVDLYVASVRQADSLQASSQQSSSPPAGQPPASTVALASADQPAWSAANDSVALALSERSAERSAGQSTVRSADASAGGGSWYGRGGANDRSGQTGTAISAIGSMAPPSVRRSQEYGKLDPPAAARGSSYQAATPQAESGVGRRFKVAATH